jgi:hypothetical protein
MLRFAQHDMRAVHHAASAGLLVLSVVIAATGLGAVRWRGQPAPVPDHATALSASAEMKVAAHLWLAQVVRPDRDGFSAVDMLLSAERAGLPGEVQLDVQELPGERVLRTSRRRAADLPAGSPWEYRPGSRREQWVTFGFEPLPDSGGKEFRVAVTYRDGRDAAGERVAALARFPRTYARGAFFVNGFEAGGTLLLRLAAQGTRGDALQTAATNLARQQPLAPGTLLAPAVVGVACLACAAAIGMALVRR